MTSPAALPPLADRAAFQAEVDALRVREKAHTHEGDAIAAARRLPMGWTMPWYSARDSLGPLPAGRPIPQWDRLAAGHSDDLAAR